MELKIHSTKAQKKMKNIRINRWYLALIVKLFSSPIVEKQNGESGKKKKEN